MTHFSEKLRKIIKYYFGREIPLEFGKYANQISMDLAISAIIELVKRIVPKEKTEYQMPLSEEPEEETYWEQLNIEGFNSCRAEMLRRVE